MILDIAFYIPGMPFDGKTVATKSLGGSETAGYYLARAFARRGHNAVVFSTCDEPGVYEDVVYRPLIDWGPYAAQTPHDVSVIQRVHEQFRIPLSSRINILWLHDLAAARLAGEFRTCLWQVDKIACVSAYHTQQVKETFSLPDSILFETRNGVDLAVVPPKGQRPRNRKAMIYAARPERGIDNLLDGILPLIFEAEPEATLTIFGYDNAPPHMADYYASLAAKARQFGNRVLVGGLLPKDKLYDAYSRAGLYLYPTPSLVMTDFKEVSCISAMEAQACGLPIVTSTAGALPQTVRPGAGALVEGNPWEPAVARAYADEALRIMRDDSAFEAMSAVGYAAAPGLDWAGVAEQWESEIAKLYEAGNRDPLRLARHFYRRSDIMAAKAVLADAPVGERAEKTNAYVALREEIGRLYAFADSPEVLRAHYEKHGKDTDARLSASEFPDNYFDQTAERRFTEIETFLREKPEIQRILDFGCGHGWCDVYLARKLGRQWLGVDTDAGAVRWSRRFADRFCARSADLQFLQGDHTIDLSHCQPFDMLLCSEVLEHLPEPWAALEAMETWVKPGGKVLLTVPHGPSEFATPNWTSGFRNHLWDFDRHDLRDMLGKKKDMMVFSSFERRNDATGEPCGFHFIVYTADHKPLGKIDMARKLRQQNPRHTITAGIMAGGPAVEETLHWCLRSITGIADEILIADCGMTDEAKRIAVQYPVTLFPCESPIKIGFEGPRNAALERATGDFFLWIDCDERMTNPHEITKYARESIFDGFSIKQYHFACDLDWSPDMPVRMFRTRPTDEGKRMRFYGMIHEHPELELNEGPGSIIILADTQIAHVGYLAEGVRRARFERNHPLLQADKAKYPTRMLQKYFLMRDNNLLCKSLIARGANGATPEVRKLCEETKALFREHFLGKNPLLNIDALAQYTEALRILGEGIDVSFDIRAQRAGTGDQLNGGYHARFADAEEAKAEITHRIEQKFAPLTRDPW